MPPLLLALLLVFAPQPAIAQTDVAALRRFFEIEGDDAFASARDSTLTFSATASRYASPNGHGFRNEAKLRKEARLPARATRERFSADVTPVLPPGAKTIVAQYHMSGTGTAMTLQVQDTRERGALDGIERNGVFDILATITGPGGGKSKVALGTIRAAETFHLEIQASSGTLRVAVRTAGAGLHDTGERAIGDDPGLYLKFGDYLQARDDGGGMTSDPAAWTASLARQGITSTRVTFSDVRFTRF